MDWNRAKNVIICMLLLVNLFLLGMIGYLRLQETRSFRESVEGTVRVLASRGIGVDESLITGKKDERRLCIIERDRTREAAVAQNLLGISEVSASGGNDRYKGEWGTAAWLSGGNFDAGFTANAAQFEQALRDSGIALPEGWTAGATGEIGQYIDGLPIFNCGLRYVIGGSTCTVSGRYCLGKPQPVDDRAPMGECSVLISYASIVSGLAIERIDAMDPGWVVQTLPGIGVRLIPVWRITSPGLVTYVNAVDGSAVLVEG